MFRSIKVGVTLGAAVLIASPGCCLPNLLRSHSAPNEEVIVSDYSIEYVGDYSTVSADCGCGCESGDVVDGQYIISTVGDEAGSFTTDSSGTANTDFQPTPAGDSPVAGSGSKAVDIVQPPADLEKSAEETLPGNFLP